MKRVEDISRFELNELCEELLGFLYMFRNSDLNNPNDVDTLQQCFYSASDIEDRILETQWTVKDVERAINEG